jgi:branched-chain amino acid transport system substrate-binding protein
VRISKFLSRILTTATACAVATVGFVVLSAAPPASAATKAPIPIGYICSCTGPLASSTLVNRPAYEAYVDWTNAHGGIDGHKIKLFLEDDDSNPATSTAEVHTLVTQDHVVAIAAIVAVASAWQSYVDGLHIPVIGTEGTEEPFYTDSNWFYAGQTVDSLPASVAIAVKKSGNTKYALFYCAESPSCQELLAPTEAAGAKYGVHISYTAEISYAAPSYTSQCLAAKESGATAVDVADALSVVEHVAQDCSAQGYYPTYIESDGAVGPAFLKIPGLKDHLFAYEPQMPFNVDSTPATKTMLGAFAKYEPGLTSNVNYNGEVDEAWVNGLLLTAAVKAGHPGNTITSAEIKKGLYTMHNQTLGGMSPPLTFHAGSKANLTDCWFWIATSHGKFVEPYGLTTTCLAKH